MDYILRGWPITPEIRKVDENYEEKVNKVQNNENKIIDKVNELDNMAQKVQSPLNFSFNRQKYVDRC